MTVIFRIYLLLYDGIARSVQTSKSRPHAFIWPKSRTPNPALGSFPSSTTPSNRITCVFSPLQLQPHRNLSGWSSFQNTRDMLFSGSGEQAKNRVNDVFQNDTKHALVLQYLKKSANSGVSTICGLDCILSPPEAYHWHREVANGGKLAHIPADFYTTQFFFCNDMSDPLVNKYALCCIFGYRSFADASQASFSVTGRQFFLGRT